MRKQSIVAIVVLGSILAGGGWALANNIQCAFEARDITGFQLANGDIMPEGDQMLLAALKTGVTEQQVQIDFTNRLISKILTQDLDICLTSHIGDDSYNDMGTLTSGDLGYPGFFQYGATFPPNNGYWDDRQLYFVGLHGGTVASPGGITQMGMWTLEGSKFQIVPDGILGYTGSYFDVEELNDSISHLGPGTCVIGQATVDGLYPAGPGTQAVFDEEGWGAAPVQATLAYVLPGDANGDGKVDINDLTIVLSHYGQTGMAWTQGEFTGDGTVDINDLTIVLAHYGQSVGAFAAATAPVPEPSCVVLLGIAVAGLLARARRRRS